jgi:heptosyltransferase-2
MPINTERVTRVLVRGPNWIGDAVMAEPALQALRRRFPAADITLLAKPAVADLFKGHPLIGRVLLYEDPGRHAGLLGKWTLAARLRRENFHLAVLFQNAFEAALLACLAGIPVRYGYATDGRAFLLTDPVPVPDPCSVLHQVGYYLAMLRPLGVQEEAGPPRLYVSEEEERRAAEHLAESGIGPGDFLLGINPGSVYGGAKRWLPERFALAADRLAEGWQRQTGRPAKTLVVGGPGEEKLGQAIGTGMRNRPVVLSGKTSVRELMAVIKRCNLFMSNDTGPMHIAAAFGVPLVAIFGPTDPRVTAPFGNDRALVRHPVECSPCLLRECPIDHRCMQGITVEMVVDAALQQVGADRRTSGQADRPGPHESMPAGQPAGRSAPLAGLTVFLDRDGTLNRDVGYVTSPEKLELFPDVIGAVSSLKRAGARVVVVTNQSGVARGLISPADLEAVHAKLRSLLEAEGASLDAIYFCPHHPDEGCACRKPDVAMIERATTQLGLDRRASYVVGDQRRDIELGHRIRAGTILVTTGPASRDHLAALREEGLPPDHVAATLSEAVEWIMKDWPHRLKERPVCAP